MLNSSPQIAVSQTSIRRNLYQHRMFKILNLTISNSPFHRCIFSRESPHVITGSDEFVQEAHKKLVFCEGYWFRDPEQVKRHQLELTKLFQMSQSIRDDVDCFEGDHPPRKDLIRVGFHLRRGDYKNYDGGKYYLTDEQWHDLINSVRQYVNKQQKRFTGILFSNENIDSFIRGADDLVAGPGGVFTDLEMLSRCDLIVAPKNTYSGWASFIGGVPLMHVNHANLNIENFEVVSW